MKLIGGQAVIEGVMMKSDSKVAVSVRLKNKKIKSKSYKIHKKHKFLSYPFIRGIFTLFDTLILGFNALTWSANQQLEKEEKITKKEIAFSFFIAFSFAVFFFIILPFFLTRLFVANGFLFNMVDGLMRIIILFVYLITISQMKDVKQIFRYHGAEHMAVHCYENKLPLTVANCKKFKTFHPRCGTAFLVIVLFISILLFSIIPAYSLSYRLLARIILVPFIASISYEFLKLSNKFKKNIFFRLLILPGLWFQRITTKKPSDEMLEVAIVSMKKVI